MGSAVMRPVKSVGVLLRDRSQPFPLDELGGLLGRSGVAMHVLNHGLPKAPLDLVIAMGGDGTVLKALDLLPNCPVLGINFGTVGFLTAGDRAELDKLVGRLLKGDYVLSERLLLRCDHAGRTTHAVNEVVLRSSWRLMSIEVSINGAKIRTIRGDGVIVGTPTGSTGYLLSLGAPIVMPDVNCFVLDGLNEYNFSSRALTLSPDCEIRLTVMSLLDQQQAHLYIDGNPIQQVAAGEPLLLRRSERRAQLVFFDEHYFFHNLSSRLSW